MNKLLMTVKALAMIHGAVRRGVRACALLLPLMASSAQAAQWAVLDQSQPGSVAAASFAGFSAAVTRATGGALSVNATPSAANTSTDTLLADLAAGRVALAALPLAALEAGDAVLAMDRVPYLATNFVDAAKLWQVLQPYVRDVLQARGLTLLYAVPSPPMAPLSRKALTQMSAWRGSSVVLSAPAIGGFARIVGARALPNASPRDALGSARADAVFESAPGAVRDKAWEYASDFLLAPAWFPKQLVVASSRAVAALPAAQRDAVLSAADVEQRNVWTNSTHAHEEGVQKLRDYGLKTREPTVGVLIQLEALGRELLFQWSDGAGETGAQLVEAYYAIR